ncbi:hypothetical protein GCM10011320_45470 [Neoroseomonas lacus]|uniref:Uncharacterized protein n=1 Tax=Neoroseomonas lacus TaxID=287609 RepID=A0A917KXT6_9PROT|nr:hypothetical protein GCM10011320_45470 [Neoroseomonas lacus]
MRSRICCIMLAALLRPMEEIDMGSSLRFARGGMPMTARIGRDARRGGRRLRRKHANAWGYGSFGFARSASRR